jgi:ubiquinone/menaquinone biosynthesis C-methylase UbiE
MATTATTEQPTQLPTPLSAEEVFDAIGPAYEDAFVGLPAQAASIQWLLSNLPPAPAHILDIGCGTGRPVCSSLADAGHSALGIDISSAMVNAAKTRVPNARFEHADIKTWSGVPAGSLDAVTIYFSIIASMTQAEIRDVLRKAFALLKPGGLFVWATVAIPAENLHIAWMGRPVVVSSLGPEDAVQAVKDAGFDVVQHAVSTFTPKSVEAGLCKPEEVWEETHLFVYARKPAAA